MTETGSSHPAPPGRVYGIADRQALGAIPIPDAVDAMATASAGPTPLTTHSSNMRPCT